MTLREKGMALLVLLALNVAVWLFVAVVRFNLVAAAIAFLFSGLSAAALGRILWL